MNNIAARTQNPSNHRSGTAPSSLSPLAEHDSALGRRSIAWQETLRPQNDFQSWIVDQIVCTSERIETSNLVDWRSRQLAATRAEGCWDSDRRLQAVELGEKLGKSPHTVAPRLQRTPHGCDWMIARWAFLLRVAESAGSWTQEQALMALNLLGIREDERCMLPPGAEADLARREITTLLKRQQDVVPADVLDRALTITGERHDPTPHQRRQRRQNADLQRRLSWFLSFLPCQPAEPTAASAAGHPAESATTSKPQKPPSEVRATPAETPRGQTASPVASGGVEPQRKPADARRDSRRQELEPARA